METSRTQPWARPILSWFWGISVFFLFVSSTTRQSFAENADEVAPSTENHYCDTIACRVPLVHFCAATAVGVGGLSLIAIAAASQGGGSSSRSSNSDMELFPGTCKEAFGFESGYSASGDFEISYERDFGISYSLAGGHWLGRDSVLEGNGYFALGFTTSLLDLDLLEMGAVSADYLEGGLHLGARIRVHPLGRMTYQRFRLSPYGTANGGGLLAGRGGGAGFVGYGAGTEFGITERQNEWVFYAEYLSSHTHTKAHTVPFSARGWKTAPLVQVGFRFRDFD